MNPVTAQLQRLTYGLADQLTVQGTPLLYEGKRLSPSEVVDLSLPSLLCLSDALMTSVGGKGLGYRFELVDVPSPVFPLLAHPTEPRPFLTIAPFVVEAFEHHTREAGYDAAHLFAAAARHLRPEFDLFVHTSYRDPLPISSAVPISLSSPTLSR